jgi:restriction endonuclease S subunit
MAKNTAAPIKITTVKLGSVAKLLRLPPGVRDEKGKSGTKKVKVISIVDLPEAGFIGKIKDSISLSKSRFSGIKKYTIQPFDLLMSIQGTVGRVGIVPKSVSGDTIANISLLAIRFKENKEDNAVALLQYLKSAAGRKLLARLQKGTTIKRINVKEFAASKVPELSPDIRRQSKAVFDGELKTYQKITAMYDTLEEIRRSYLS